MPTSRRALRLLAAATVILLAAAGPELQPTDIVAQSGNTVLTVADVQALLAHLDPAVRDQVQRNPTALTELVRTRLVQQELLDAAKAKQWDQDPDVQYRANLARDTVIADTYLASLTRPDPSYPSDADVQAAYDANKSRFVVPRQYHLAQIFIALPADGTKQADEDAQKKLREAKQALARPHADFADSAKRLSQDQASAARGGDLGWLRDDQLVQVIKDAVAGLPDNGVSDPIRATDGWHLVKLIATKPATTASLAEAKDALVRALRQQKATENARAYVRDLQAKTPVELNEIALARVAPH
jgi:parvulin-like peptidyl-prolyl isomerase